MSVEPRPSSEILLYQTEDGLTRLDIRFEGESLWLTQNQMADLFQTSKQNISLHLKNVFSEGELAREATVKEYLTVQAEGARSVTRGVEYYHLDAVIAKNYLNPEELEVLNRIVTAYLEFAELQGLNRKPMHMRDWIAISQVKQLDSERKSKKKKGKAK
jgi:hypothetical protein